MITIYKYELHVGEDTQVDLPVGARPLSALFQAGQNGKHRLFMWVQVFNPIGARTESRLFLAAMTGQDLVPRSLKFVATAQTQRGGEYFVAHVFEVMP